MTQPILYRLRRLLLKISFRPVSAVGIVALCLGGALNAQATYQVGFQVMDFTLGERPLTVAIWYPTDVPSARFKYGDTLATDNVALDAPLKANSDGWPLLAWSHGYGGGGIGSVFLAESLAAEGWIVAAPDHADRDQVVRIRTGPQDVNGWAYLKRARELAATGRNFDRQAHAYRPKELQRTIDGILESETFGPHINREQIAAGGHSLGGYTALALHMQHTQCGDDTFSAILLFSPGVFMFAPEEIAQVTAPTMYWLGEKELTQTRGQRSRGELADAVYADFPAPKYFMELKDAGHFTFNNGYSKGLLAQYFQGTPEQFDTLTRYSIPFLQKYTQGAKIEVPIFDPDIAPAIYDNDISYSRKLYKTPNNQ